VRSRLPLASTCVAILLSSALCQTYDIHGGAAPAPGQQTESGASSDQNPQGSSNLGWGSSIEVARRARAAQEAINRGDYANAVQFAEQAANSAPQSVDLWFLLGYAARLAQQYQTSLDAYNRGLRIQPDSVRGLAGLAQTYARMGHDAEAERLLQRVIHSNSKDVNSLRLAGELLLNTDPNNALQLLRRADTLQPSARTELLMARSYQHSGNKDQAKHYLQLAKSKGPTNPEVLRAVADEYRDEGQYDQAIATLQAIPSKSTDTQGDLAYTYQLAGKQEEAAKLYSRLAKSARGNIGLDLSAAQALINLGQFDAAHPFIEDAGRIDPNHYRLHSILGQIALSQDQVADARAEYSLALRHLPPSAPEGPLYPIELRLNLYELDLREGDPADAANQLKAAQAEIQSAQVSPASRPELLRLRAAVETASGNLDAANRDLKEALSLAPSNVNVLLNYASLQWKRGQKEAARATFDKALQMDKNNRTALSSLGYLARDTGNTKEAESYFMRAATSHPRDFAPHLALGDLYTSERKFHAAETEYEKAYDRMPANTSVISGAANAALEGHNLDLAKHWLDRAQGSMNDDPVVNRERERYLTFKGEYEDSARLGYSVLQQLPNDREGVVYLLYDLYYLARYDEVQKLVQRYDSHFSDDKDFALISGYLAVRNSELETALADFTKALASDPRMATGYVSRGFVLNDLRQPDRAALDFEAALHIQPDYAEAHLGLAYADLQRHRPRSALMQLNAAGKSLGKTHAWHLARAEAYRQGQDYSHAAPEYRLALQESPNDVPTQLAYADSLYRLGDFPHALTELTAAGKLAPTNPEIYALGAQIYARQNDREDAHREIKLAEQYGNDQTRILLTTGNALLTLDEKDAAMQRFTRALDAPGESHLAVRLALARLFAERGDFDGTRRQVALGFAEARAEDSPVSSEDILQAANVFLAIHDFDLAETYFRKSHSTGADPRSVTIGLTNTYLAEGKTQEAAKELASLGPATDYRDDYEYMMTAANLYRQRQDSVRSLSAFAQANSVASRGDGDTAEIAQYQAAEQEGRELNETFSILPEATFSPAFEDINVYALDAKILGVASPAMLPPPRHSYQSLVDSHYRIHVAGLPVISGFVGESLTAGRLLFPSVNVVEDRNTYDTFLNGGISPVLHFGSNSITFNGGLQYTIRRDTISPQLMSQNLFRQFLYVSTNSFFNWLSIHGSATREAGPFTDRDLHSRDAFANVEFTVGRPWGNTSLLAGYSVRDLLFHPSVIEYFTTSTYVGLQHKFGDRLSVALLAESLRSWEVFHSSYAIAQAALPGARFDLRATPRWSVHGSFLLSRGQGFHQYDNAQSEFTVSYVRPVHGTLKDGGDVPVSYPLRFSFGVEQQTFYNFAGSTRTTLLPVFHLTLF